MPAPTHPKPAQKRQSPLWNREYEVRTLDVHGDAQDVSHFATEAQAVKYARDEVKDTAVAAVVEYHETRYKSARADRSENYTEVVAFGDPDAIRAFGWDDESKIHKP